MIRGQVSRGPPPLPPHHQHPPAGEATPPRGSAGLLKGLRDVSQDLVDCVLCVLMTLLLETHLIPHPTP